MRSFSAGDLRYAARSLSRSPGFTATVIATLAVAIGANCAIFSVVDAALLKPLPFRDSDRLVRLRDVQRLSSGGARPVNTSPENYRAIAQSEIFEGVAAQEFHLFNSTGAGRAAQVRGIRVSPGWLRFLGIAPAAGRDFLPVEAGAGSSSHVVLIGHRLWNERFGGLSSAVGSTLTLDGQAYTVVGVLPSWMNFPYDSDLWMPGELEFTEQTHRLNVVARLRPGSTVEAAVRALEALARRLEKDEPATHSGWRFAAIPLRDEVLEDRAKMVVALFAVVALLLAIACANLCSLFLARTAARENEAAIRRALGASALRQVLPSIFESVLVAAAGSGAGVLAAVWGRGLLSSLTAPLAHELGSMAQLELNGRVLGYTAALGALTIVVLAVLPASRLLRGSPPSCLVPAGRATGGRGYRRLLTAITIAEVALVALMLQGSGLLVENTRRLQNRDLGFDRRNLLTVRLALAEDPYSDAVRRAVYLENIRDRVQALPGVVSADFTTLLPVGEGGTRTTVLAVEGRPSGADEQLAANLRYVTAGYFQTLGIRMVAGRTFTDGERRTPTPVVVVNRAMVRRYWPGQDPLGRRVKAGPEGSSEPWLTVVGVVEDVRDRGDLPETWYLPVPMGGRRSVADREPFLLVRTRVEPRSLALAVTRAIASVDASQPLSRIRTMEEVYARTLASPRQGAVLSAVVSAFALIFAGLGVAGILSYSVRQRSREIGIRIALGATRRAILGLVVGDGVRMALAGILLGVLAFFPARALLLRIVDEAATPLASAGISAAALATLGAVVLAACLLPALRAARVDPITTLRSE
jgi:putative ABC transport system permease protein